MGRKKKEKKGKDPVPLTIFQCTEIFKLLFEPEQVEEFRQMRRDELRQLHFGLGLYIRNFWLRKWPHLLMQWFCRRAANGCPDTYSGIIIEVMWLELNGTVLTDEIVDELIRSRGLLSKEERERQWKERAEAKRLENLQTLERWLAEAAARRQ